MGKTKIVEHDGKQVTAEEVEFECLTPENWLNYKLSDGSTLKMKTSLMDVYRIVGEYQKDTGDPVYQFTSQQILTITAPEELKRPKD